MHLQVMLPALVAGALAKGARLLKPVKAYGSNLIGVGADLNSLPSASHRPPTWRRLAGAGENVCYRAERARRRLRQSEHAVLRMDDYHDLVGAGFAVLCGSSVIGSAPFVHHS